MMMRSKSVGWPLAFAAVGMMAGPVAVPAMAQTITGRPTAVDVNTGQGKLITLPAPMSDIFLSNDNIADVQVRSPTQLYVFGKAQGETTLFATSKTGKVIYSATVRVGQNVDTVGQMLALAMPEAKITATPMNGLILLTGTVATPDDAAQAEQLVSAYVGTGIRVLSRLKTATPLQVNLQVRFAEVSRNFVKNIGVNFGTVDGTSGFKFGIAQGRSFSPQYTPGGALGTGFTSAPTGGSLVSQVASGTTIGLAGKLLGLDVLSALDLGERNGQVTTLANPNLTVLSGETGSFLAGGEIPIPVSQGLGAVSVDYKQYGVSLAYTPTVLSDGRISLRLKPEVSQLSSAGAVQISGTTIPALTTRRVETTVELGSGQSFMVAGLLQSDHNNSIDKTPGIGDVPILGALFRSNAFQRNETELVVVITPYLVKPVESLADIHLPTDGYAAPGDLQRVLLGDLSGDTKDPRPVPKMVQGDGSPTLGASAPLPDGPPAPLAAPAPVPVQRDRKDKGKPAAAGATPGFSAGD